MASNLSDAVREPQKAYMWQVKFYGSGVDGGVSAFNAKSVSTPSQVVDVAKRYYCGAAYLVPGKDTSPKELNVTFWDNEGLPIYDYFHKWRELLTKGTDAKRVSPMQYFREVDIDLLDASGESTVATFTLKSAFPSEIGEASLSYSESAEFQFDVKISFGEMKVKASSQNMLANAIDIAQTAGISI